jgi:chromosome segregation ATPase
LTVRLNERGEQGLKLAAENSEVGGIGTDCASKTLNSRLQLQNRLAAANDSKAKAETELSETKKSRDILTKEYRQLAEKCDALQEALEESEKRTEDGKAAHQEDVTKERAKYEELKAIQDSLKERYQTGELVSTRCRRLS